MPIKVLAGLGFGLASAASDWIFGGCLAYDLVARAVGQKGDWGKLLGVHTLGAAGTVPARNIAREARVGSDQTLPQKNTTNGSFRRPPYADPANDGYKPAAEEEGV